MNKRKQSPQRLTRHQRYAIIGVTLALTILLVGLIALRVMRRISDDPVETVVVPFDRAESTLTQNLYDGQVILRISGTGQAGGKDYSDAFYLYQQSDGTSYFPPQLEHFDLEIDGDRAIRTLGPIEKPPSYSPDHVYTVHYNVGLTPRPIALRISDSVVGDNTGAFQVQIYRAE